jgi:hypothetical protein
VSGGSGIDYSGLASLANVNGSGTVANVQTDFDNTTRESAGSGIVYAAGFNNVTTANGGDITGTATFQLTGPSAGTAAGGRTYSGFGSSSSATTVTGAVDFDDTASSNQGMTFANVTSVTGTGTITNVVSDFDDATRVSLGSSITYSAGFTAATTANGGTITGIAADFNIVTGVSSATGRTYTGFAGLTGAGANNGITGGNGLTYLFAGPGANDASANGYSWTSFERIVDTGSATFDSATPTVSVVAIITGTLDLTGTATTWELKTPSTVNGQTNASGVTLNGNPLGGTAAPDIYYNGVSQQGPTGGTLGQVLTSIGGVIAEIAARALDEAFDTDSVAKQIKDGIVGDIGTSPPIDHRLDDTGISVPDCFNESREGQGSC